MCSGAHPHPAIQIQVNGTMSMRASTLVLYAPGFVTLQVSGEEWTRVPITPQFPRKKVVQT